MQHNFIKSKRRFIAGFLAVIIAFSLVGCSQRPASTSAAANDAVASAVKDYESPYEDYIVELTGWKANDKAIAVNGEPVPASLYLYCVGCCAAAAGILYDDEMAWDDEFLGSTVEQYVRDNARNISIHIMVVEELAKVYDVELTEAHYSQIQERRAQDIIDAGGENAYIDSLNIICTTIEAYERVQINYYLQDLLRETFNDPESPNYVNDDIMLAYAEDLGYITADQILFYTIDPATGQKLSDEEIAEKKALADEISGHINTSDSPAALFVDFADMYSEDEYRDEAGARTFLVEEENDAVFAKNAAAMTPGQISEVIESEYGYHIIYRQDLYKPEAIELARDVYFTNILTAAIASAKVTGTNKLDDFDIAAFCTAIAETQESYEDSRSATPEAAS